jgi:hypothetical protein
MHVNGQTHIMAALWPKKEPRVGPRAGLDVMEKKTIYCPWWESNCDPSAVKLVA